MLSLFVLEEGSSLVHLVREVKCKSKVRQAQTKCELTIIDDADTRPEEWTGWNSRVTCPRCVSMVSRYRDISDSDEEPLIEDDEF